MIFKTLIFCSFNLTFFSINCLQVPITINKDQPFIPFDLSLSQQDKQILQGLIVSPEKEWDYSNFGRLENLEPEVIQFFRSIGNDEKQAQAGAQIISAIVIQSLQRLQAPTAWVTIRSFQPHKQFNTPRWHTDGYYFQPFEGQQYKIACALKGQSTLFCKVTDYTRSKFIKIEKEKENRSIIRTKLAKLLADHHIDQAQTAQGMLFIVGDSNCSAVHSEPPIHEDRLFISILPGTHEQIQEFHDRWHPTK